MISLKMHHKEVQRPSGQSSPNSRNKFPFARPLTVQNFVTIRQQVSEISTIKNLFPKKVGQSSPKFFRGCYSPKPLTMQNFVAIDKKMSEITAIKNLCSPKSVCPHMDCWTGVVTKIGPYGGQHA